MSKIPQTRVPLDAIIDQFNWKLTREDDDSVHIGRTAHWIEWEEGRYKSHHTDPAIGRSCILDIHPWSFTWQTTEVVEILESSDARVKFRTKNSTYVLEKIDSVNL